VQGWICAGLDCCLRRLLSASLEQSFVRGTGACQTDVDGGLTAVVGLVFESFFEKGISGGFIGTKCHQFAEFGGVEIFYALDCEIIAFGDIENDGVLCLGAGAGFDVSGGEIGFGTGSELDETNVSLCEVEHLLRETADAVDGLEGVFIGGHGIEVVERIGFCAFPVLDELFLYVGARNVLGFGGELAQ
jgi:hypothetical protein